MAGAHIINRGRPVPINRMTTRKDECRSRGRLHPWVIIYLLLTAVGLLSSFLVYRGVLETTREYYGYLSEVSAQGASADIKNLSSCDLLQQIRLLSERPEANDVKVAACDVMMYSGGAAVVGFLSFLLVYFVGVVGSVVVVGMTPQRWKRQALVLCSVIFLFVALPLRPAIWLLAFVTGVCFVWQLPVGGRVRAALILAGLFCFYTALGPTLTEACRTEFFTMSRASVDAPRFGNLLASVNDFLEGVHLGRIGDVRGHDDGFPYAFLMLALLLKVFRRVLRFAHEMWTGRIDPTSDCCDFFVYFIGLHTLVGEAATVSFRDMRASRGNGPSPLEGARTLAWCLGFGSLAYCALVTLASSPAVRVLFPRCDIPVASEGAIWMRMITVFVIQYTFLIATSQASIGVARLFGYGLRDNYEGALASWDPAEFWRRWNVHWREFLVTIFYYPTLLRLARGKGRQMTWHVYAATMVTFAGTLLLNVLPLSLISSDVLHLAPTVVHPSEMMREARADAVPHVATVDTDWRDTLPSSCLYYLADGIAVSLFLGLAMKRRSRPEMHRGWRLAVGIAATLAFMALVRTLLDSDLNLHDQLLMMRRAVGIP